MFGLNNNDTIDNTYLKVEPAPVSDDGGNEHESKRSRGRLLSRLRHQEPKDDTKLIPENIDNSEILKVIR